MSVRLEVNTDIVSHSSVVEVLYSGLCADGWKLQHFFDIVSASSVGIRSLDDADFELLRDSCISRQVTDERCGKRRDAVAVKEPEYVVLVEEIVD